MLGNVGGDSSVVERRVSDRKVADPGSIPELGRHRCVNGKNPLRFFPLWSSSLPVVEARPDERLANRTFQKCSALLVWLDRRKVLVTNELTNETFLE